MIDFAAANRARDKRLRRRMLRIMDAAKSSPAGIGGEMLRDLVNSLVGPTERFDDDEHVISLGQDLVNSGLILMDDQRTLKTQKFSIEFLGFRITAKGTGLVNQQIAPEPLVDDDRM